MTYFGEQLRGISTPAFLVIASAIIALLTTAAILIERSVNRLVDLLLSRRSPPPAQAPGAV